MFVRLKDCGCILSSLSECNKHRNFLAPEFARGNIEILANKKQVEVMNLIDETKRAKHIYKLSEENRELRDKVNLYRNSNIVNYNRCLRYEKRLGLKTKGGMLTYFKNVYRILGEADTTILFMDEKGAKEYCARHKGTNYTKQPINH